MSRGSSRYVLALLMLLLVTKTFPVGNALSQNLKNLKHRINDGSNFVRERYIAPINAVLLYVPWKNDLSTWDKPLPQLARELSQGDRKTWEEVTRRSPVYSTEAINSEWSLLGYDVLSYPETVVRLYWQSSATYAESPILTMEESVHTLAVGQRFYQDVVVNNLAFSERPDEGSEITRCPPSPSILGNTVSLIDNPDTVYAVPVAFAGDLCFFSFMVPDIGSVGVIPENGIVEEERDGAWVLLSKKAPHLDNPLPLWNFASVQSMLGWRSANSQTTLDLAEAGLLVTSSGIDASIVGPPVALDARQMQQIVVVSRANSGSTIELFWTTLDSRHFSQQMSKALRQQSDGLWHTYEFDLSGEERWHGVITRLRLDPTDASGSVVLSAISVQ